MQIGLVLVADAHKFLQIRDSPSELHVLAIEIIQLDQIVGFDLEFGLFASVPEDVAGPDSLLEAPGVDHRVQYEVGDFDERVAGFDRNLGYAQMRSAKCHQLSHLGLSPAHPPAPFHRSGSPAARPVR